MTSTPVPHRRLRDTRAARFLQARWRFVFAVAVGIALGLFLPGGYHLTSRFLIGFDAGVALYLVLVVVMILRSDANRVRRESPLQDEGRIAIPILTVAAGMASLGAIVFWLRTASESETVQPGLLALLFVTTLLSWLFIHTMFARMNITRSTAARAAACASPAAASRTIGTSSISPSPSAPRRRCPTLR